MSRSSFFRELKHLDIEEKILNAGALLALAGVCMPWFGGDWFGERQVWNGFGFYTSFIGLLIFLANAFVLSMTVLPIVGYQIVRASRHNLIRFIIGLESVLLAIVAVSVFTNVTFDFSQVEIRFGVYVSLVGSIIVSLYSFLRMQQSLRRSTEEIFRFPDDKMTPLRPSSPSPTSQPLSRSPVQIASMPPRKEGSEVVKQPAFASSAPREAEDLKLFSS